jgi:hypothetical protein
MLIFLSAFCIPQLASASYTLPDFDKTQKYVNNLIDSYNALVAFPDRYRPDFDSIKVYLKLYHDVGYSFRVIVAQAIPPQMVTAIPGTPANMTDFLDLLFIPIMADRPDIVMEYDKTASEIGGFGGLTGECTLREDLRIEYEGGITYQVVAFSILKSDISNNYMENSKNAAKLIYQADQQRVPPLTQTQVVPQTTITQEQTTSIQTTQAQNTQGQNPIVAMILWLRDNILVPLVVFMGILVAVLVTYFGSVRDALRFLIDKRERKAVESKLAKSVLKLLGRKEQLTEEHKEVKKQDRRKSHQ